MIPDEFAYAPMHWHSEFEINFVREGFAEFNCGDEKFVSSAGDIIVIPVSYTHLDVYKRQDEETAFAEMQAFFQQNL